MAHMPHRERSVSFSKQARGRPSDSLDGSTSSESLEALEEQLGAHLPETYRRFLREHNGGQPTPDVVDVDGLPGSPTDIQVFFGIGCTVESSEIEWNRRTFSGRIPSRMLPIACDSGGGLFCLSLSGQDSGSVIYVDAQGPMSIEYPVATDFDAFLRKIQD